MLVISHAFGKRSKSFAIEFISTIFAMPIGGRMMPRKKLNATSEYIVKNTQKSGHLFSRSCFGLWGGAGIVIPL